MLCIATVCTGNTLLLTGTSAFLAADQILTITDDTSPVTYFLEGAGMTEQAAISTRNITAAGLNLIYPVQRGFGVASSIQSSGTIPMSIVDKISDRVWATSSAVSASSLSKQD